ncbi:MAG: HAD family hydrolase [Promethearchaeota archaeon]
MTNLLINNLNLDKIKAIVFDWDGTLFNNVPAIKAATQNVLKKFNINYFEEEVINEFVDLIENIHDNNLPNILLNHYKILDNIPLFRNLSYLQKLQVLFLIYSKYKQYSEGSQLYTGTEELLEELAPRFDLAIFSSSKREEMIQTLEKFGILSYFKSILTSDEVKYPKPNPEGIQKVLQQLKHHPKNVLYVGDSVLDILTARAANMPSIAISNGLIPRQNLLEQSPNMIYEHVTELTQLFDLPKILINKEIEQVKTINYHAEKIKSYVKEDFNFFTLLQEVLPSDMKFEPKQVGKIIEDPLGFVGAVITDGIAQYTRGEIELKNQFTEFSKNEEDLLKCLGLIIIHFVNERSNNLIKNLIQNPLTKLSSTITGIGLKLSYQHFYPSKYKKQFRSLFLKLFREIIPPESFEYLQELDETDFTASVLDGCELALYDLGMPKLRSIDFKSIKPLSRSFSNLLLKGPTMIIQEFYKRFNEISQDILEHDLRRYPGD